jgi:hypothetical protein
MVLALAPATLKAQTLPKLVLTEESPSVLTVTLDGVPSGTVKNISSDHWVWDSGVITDIENVDGVGGTAPNGRWQEPGSSTLFNTINLIQLFPPGSQTFTGGLEFFSDKTFPSPVPSNPDGSSGFILSMHLGNTLVFGPAEVFVFDKGDGSTVPDSSSTLGLMLSAVAMYGLARMRMARASQARQAFAIKS